MTVTLKKFYHCTQNTHKIALCYKAKERWVQLSRLYHYKLFSAVLENPKQENLRIRTCMEPKKTDTTTWWGNCKRQNFSVERGVIIQKMLVLCRILHSCIFRHNFLYIPDLERSNIVGHIKFHIKFESVQWEPA